MKGHDCAKEKRVESGPENAAFGESAASSSEPGAQKEGEGFSLHGEKGKIMKNEFEGRRGFPEVEKR